MKQRALLHLKKMLSFFLEELRRQKTGFSSSSSEDSGSSSESYESYQANKKPAETLSDLRNIAMNLNFATLKEDASSSSYSSEDNDSIISIQKDDLNKSLEALQHFSRRERQPSKNQPVPKRLPKPPPKVPPKKVSRNYEDD